MVRRTGEATRVIAVATAEEEADTAAAEESTEAAEAGRRAEEVTPTSSRELQRCSTESWCGVVADTVRAWSGRSRRKERDASSVTIWPPSPKEERPGSPSDRDKDKKRGSSSRSKHKSSSSRRRASSVSSDSDSEDERRRRRRREKERDSGRDKDRSSSDRHRSSSSRHHSSSSRHKESSSSRKRDRSEDEDDHGRRGDKDARVLDVIAPIPEADEGDPRASAGPMSAGEGALEVHSSDEEVGPQPISGPGRLNTGAYGGALRKGEGAAMAAFVEEGARIPRRGEIGMNSDIIEKFEQAGYVMSGSRHKRMNAVRIRKENQVITAEEKRAILHLQATEKAKRENEIVASFRELVDNKLGAHKQ